MPEAAAVAIYNFVNAAVLSAGAGAVAASTAGHVAVSAASVAATTALSAAVNKVIADANAPEPQGGLTSLRIGPDEPRRLQIGSRLNGGTLVDWYVEGSKNQFLYMVVYLGEGPMGNCTALVGGGRTVRSTNLTHGTRTVIPAYHDPDGDRLWVTYYDGRVGQTADSYLVGRGLGWTSDCVGTGCAYAIIEAKWDPDNMASPPDIAFVTEGAKLYDRRLDTTAGGSGSQRHDDPTTWAVSDNPAVALDHYLLGRYLGSVKTFGVGLPAEDVPYDRFAALANLCDEDVDLKVSGTQKRYRVNGIISAARPFDDTIKDFCRQMHSRPADFGGRIGILDGQPRTPVLSITDDDLIEGSQEQYAPKRSWSELVSEVRGTYQNPAANFEAVNYPTVTDAAWVSADGGSPKPADINFEMETNAERAERLAWLYAMRERRQAQLTGTYKPHTIELEQGDWFTRVGGIFGAGKNFEVINRVFNPKTLSVTITAFEVDSADSAWVASQATDPLPAPVANTDTVQRMEVPSLTVSAITLSGSNSTVPVVKVEWTAPDDPRVTDVVIEAVPLGGVPAAYTVDPDIGEVLLDSGILDGVEYYVRARFKGEATPSAWSTVHQVTTGATFTVGTATSVAWSGVTGAGRPDDNADVTGDNTAGAIVDQAPAATDHTIEAGATAGATWGTNIGGALRPDDNADVTGSNTAAAITDQSELATSALGESDVENALVGQGKNLLKNPSFLDAPAAGLASDTPDFWSNFATTDGTGNYAYGVTGSSYFTAWAPDGERGLFVQQSDTETGVIYDWRGDGVLCAPGDRVIASVYTGAHRCDIQCLLEFYDSSGASLGTTVGSGNASEASGGTLIGGYKRIFAAADAPANTAYAKMNIRKGATTSGGDSYGFYCRPMLEIGGPGQASPSAYDGLRSLDALQPGEAGADRTGDHNAASFTGQGGLATANRASRRVSSALTTTSIIGTYTNTEFTITGGDYAVEIDNIYSDVASVTITCDGSPVELEFSAYFGEGLPGTTTESPELKVKAKLKRGSTVIADGLPLACLRADGQTVTRNFGGTYRIIDAAPGGTPASPISNTYTIQLATPATSAKSPASAVAFVNPNIPSYFRATTYEADANQIL